MNLGAGKPTAIDLFCGAGGLSLGLERAGFNVVAGVEINPEIAKTYEANHPNAKLLTKDVREVTGKQLLELTNQKEITLVAGCPPCQGFSSLTYKYRKEDLRNGLALEMARLIGEIKPKMVMMENVPGLAKRGKPILDEFVSKLESYGYFVQKDTLQLADYGIPQSRRRLVLLAGLGFSIPLPKATHCHNGDKKAKLKPWATLRNVLKNVLEPVTLSYAKKKGSPKKFKWHVVRDVKELTKERLKAVRPGGDRRSLPISLRPDCHVYTNTGFSNVYGRLDWDQTPPTMTGGCTTFCKGRFGHPERDGTISVMEAALIQTFPKSYKFNTKFMDIACDLVGNALPPKFAEIAGKACLNAMSNR